jgi:glyoxylase-like metal-dependent hydrolase (beta-lactamase superfamily II)
VILTVALLCFGAAASAEEPGTRELAPGLFLMTGLGEAGNVAFLTTPEGAIVVDSGENEQHGKRILEQVRSRSPEPVRYLVLTHLHSDHTLGAPEFPASTLVVGQRGLAAAMEKDLAWQLEAYPPHIEKVRAAVERARAAGDPSLAKEETRLARNLAAFDEVKRVRLRLPQVEVDGTVAIRLGGQTVEVRSAAPSHTGDSAVVRFPAQRAAHFGDLLFAGSHPYIDARAGADTEHWIELLEEARAWDLGVVIPGHGPVGGKELLDAQIGYLKTLRREVAATIAAGLTAEQATERVGAAMRAAYSGYKWEEGLPDDIAAVWGELH